MLGTTAAWLYGVILIFIGGHLGKQDHLSEAELHAYHKQVHMTIHEHAHNFEISATLICVVLLGKYLESFSKKQTVEKLSQLASLKVSKAILVTKSETKKSEEEEEEQDINIDCEKNEEKSPTKLLTINDIDDEEGGLMEEGNEIDIDLLVVGDIIKIING